LLAAAVTEIDLAQSSVRALNERLHRLSPQSNDIYWRVLNPNGAHAIAVGITQPLQLEIKGHVGYYCAGMNVAASVIVDGHAGPGVAENIMSGIVRVRGNASQSAAASGRGGLVVIEGNAGARCGISMKGVEIVVAGSVGHMSAFMGQAGVLLICGEAGLNLGDSLYEAEIFVAGAVASLGADCIESEMTADDAERVASLLDRARISAEPTRFRHYRSARRLYNFRIDHAAEY
jgi:methylamine---glutamate N-methyltransferase subunit B